jgi:hypothetical protein
MDALIMKCGIKNCNFQNTTYANKVMMIENTLKSKQIVLWET